MKLKFNYARGLFNQIASKEDNKIKKASFKLLCDFIQYKHKDVEFKELGKSEQYKQLQEHKKSIVMQLQILKPDDYRFDSSEVFEGLKVQSIGVINKLLENSGMKITDKCKGGTVVHRAIRDGLDIDFGRALISYNKADPLLTDDSDHTPVQMIIAEGSFHTIKGLDWVKALYECGGNSQDDKEVADSSWSAIAVCFDNSTFNHDQAVQLLAAEAPYVDGLYA